MVSAVPDEAYYLPGETVEIELSFTNVTKRTITLNPFPPEIQVKPPKEDEVVFSVAAGTKPSEIEPDDTVNLGFVWNQKDKDGKQVPPGWYNVVLKELTITQEGLTMRQHMESHIEARLLIQYPQGAMERSLDPNQSETVNGITVTLESVELTSTGMTVYAFNTPPGYTPPQGNLPTSPFMVALAEYSVDGSAVKQTGPAGFRFLEDRTRFTWETLDPVPSDASELSFRIRMSYAGKPEELLGPWEFKIPLR